MNKINVASSLLMASDAIDSVLNEWHDIPDDIARVLSNVSTLCWRLSCDMRIEVNQSIDAEIKEIDELLADIPEGNIIERMSLEAMRTKLEDYVVWSELEQRRGEVDDEQIKY